MNYTIPRPIPRLRHIKPNQTVILAGERKPRRLLMVDDIYGYFADQSIVCLSHPVSHALMAFGEGGWQIKTEAAHAHAIHR